MHSASLLVARRETNESARTKERVLCHSAATPHCTKSNKLLEDSQHYADMMAAVRAREAEGIIVTAQFVKEDGQKQTQRQTGSLNKAAGKKTLYINKEGNDNDGAAAESNDSQGWRCPVGGRVTHRGTQPIREGTHSPQEDGREVKGRKPKAPDTLTNTGADGGCGLLF